MSMSYIYVGNTCTMKSSIIFYLTYSRISLSVILCPPEFTRVTWGGSR
jgi:hypothetical protein